MSIMHMGKKGRDLGKSEGKKEDFPYAYESLKRKEKRRGLSRLPRDARKEGSRRKGRASFHPKEEGAVGKENRHS